MAGASRPSWLADATEATTTFVAGKTYGGNGSVLFDGGTTAGYGGQFNNTGTHYVEFTVDSSFRLYGIGCYASQLLGLNLYRRLDASTWSASLGVLTTLSAVDTWGKLWPDILPAGTYKLSVSNGGYTTYTELFCEAADPWLDDVTPIFTGATSSSPSGCACSASGIESGLELWNVFKTTPSRTCVSAATAPYRPWFQLQFNVARKLSAVKLHFTGNNLQPEVQLKIRASNDGSTWTDIFTGGIWNTSTYPTIFYRWTPPSTGYTYWRFEDVGVDSSVYFDIDSCYVYENMPGFTAVYKGAMGGSNGTWRIAAADGRLLRHTYNNLQVDSMYIANIPDLSTSTPASPVVFPTGSAISCTPTMNNVYHIGSDQLHTKFYCWDKLSKCVYTLSISGTTCSAVQGPSLNIGATNGQLAVHSGNKLIAWTDYGSSIALASYTSLESTGTTSVIGSISIGVSYTLGLCFHGDHLFFLTYGTNGLGLYAIFNCTPERFSTRFVVPLIGVIDEIVAGRLIDQAGLAMYGKYMLVGVYSGTPDIHVFELSSDFSVPPTRVLFVEGSDVKTWSGTTFDTVGSTPVTQSMFENSGVLPAVVSTIPAASIDTLSQGSKVVVYRTSTATSTTTLTAVPNRRLLVMNQDISLSSVSNIDSFSLTATTSGSGAIRALASVDGGTTWQSLIGGVWSMVDSSDLDSVLSNGFTPTAFNAVTSTQWNTLRGTQDRIRFAFYIQQVSSTDTASIDTLSSVFDMAGTWHGARLGTDYTFYYDKDHLIVSILSAGSYKVNYDDGISSEDGTSGVTDHGALTGLTDDDHLHYLTAERGDVRYTLNTSSRLLPSGGAIGEVVGKTGSDSYAVGWIAVSGGGSTGGEMSQETHLDVVNGDSGSAVSSSNPKTYTIAMPYQAEFKVGKVNVLKLVAGVQNSVVTWCSFDNSDSTSFVANSYILFDGYMHLKTSYTETVTRVGSLGSGYQYRTTVDISNFTRLETVYVS